MASDWSYASGRTPDDYRCGKCGAEGVRLWRLYQTSHVDLTCLACTERDQPNRSRTESLSAIGWRVAAVPTEEGAGYWGYCAVPESACAWWYALPLTHAVCQTSDERTVLDG